MNESERWSHGCGPLVHSYLLAREAGSQTPGGTRGILPIPRTSGLLKLPAAPGMPWHGAAETLAAEGSLSRPVHNGGKS